MDRRRFLATSPSATSAALILDARPLSASGHQQQPSDLDVFIRSKMERDHIPGVAAAIFDTERVLWNNTYGWADMVRHTPMTLDHLQNIGSVSKTFTTTAAMQLWEEGLFALDDDVNEYLPFRVQNPNNPGRPITFRHLVTHRSSIRDGSAYPRFYACGDPRISLYTWLSEYFSPDGHYYSAEENFHPWAPGQWWAYCNVAYGLLAYLVETVSGVPFADYCRRNVFVPLQMDDTGWYLARIDPSRHVVPYTWVENGIPRPSDEGWNPVLREVPNRWLSGAIPRGPLGVILPDGQTQETPLSDGYHANCPYNHPNFPDGFLRTSVHQIVPYLQAYLNRGLNRDYSLLRADTIDSTLTTQFQEGDRHQGLTWYAGTRIGGELAWGHTGRDPGINTDVRMLRARGIGAAVFTNSTAIRPWEITTRLLEVAVAKELRW